MPHAVLVRFKMGDKEEVAAFLPGRMFVNGTDNLLKFGKTPELLAAILDTQLDIKVSFVLGENQCCGSMTFWVDPDLDPRIHAYD
jgi:hypothetical protein